MDYYGEMAIALETMNGYLSLFPHYEHSDDLETFFSVLEEKSTKYKFMCIQTEKTLGRGSSISYRRMRAAYTETEILLKTVVKSLKNKQDQARMDECTLNVLSHYKHPIGLN